MMSFLHATRVGPDKLRMLLPALDSSIFDPSIFSQTGVFVVRRAIPESVIRSWQSTWSEFYEKQLSRDRKVNRFNPVAVDETPPTELAEMHRHPAILDVVEQAFGPDIGLYNQRFVIKDFHSRGPVFVHSDFPYHIGWPLKASAFVPLSEVDSDNGGLTFYVGTHQFGYLGDAGEVNCEVLGPDWPTICPPLIPGDIALMHSCTWHGSGPHVRGPDRVLADIIYQPANDPSCVELLRGQWRTEVFLKREGLFQRCRSSRLQDMQRRLDELEAHPTG